MDEAEHKIEDKVKVTEGSGPAPVAPAPADPAISKQQTEPSGIAGVIAFVVSAFGELQKITWPDRQQVIKETLSVIVLVAIITAAVLAFDYALGHLVFNNIDHLARKFGGGIGVHH
ncbi:MAG: preprotein translocase subunit SecE [Candidatus Obscuribacterales bacterium]|nr:preprotein translocase subunit SecE [Candidatus Obscuribacterales bacterium]